MGLNIFLKKDIIYLKKPKFKSAVRIAVIQGAYIGIKVVIESFQTLISTISLKNHLSKRPKKKI